ncbi:hypothetical protein ACJ8KP_09555 [Bifidobacterium breve]|uniref:hypothetical protein n=1 Tax=Bifidobacterium breve TaxID=1685 RepID=UPI0002FC18E9|nr:hypothetical protein [Bifidobacterium breve]OPG86667.1 hypothetical protein B5D08_03525 [Bifidobacterium breve]
MMKSGTRRRAAILTAVMLLLSGCGTTPNGGTSGSGGMLTWQQANEEYKATVEDFPFELMNGDAFPANIPKAQAASSLYAKGSGEGQAYVYWQRSVERDILDNSQTNAEAARGALQQLRKLLDTDWFKNYYEDKDGIYENDVIGKSELGDYSTMRDFYTTDCTWYRHENGPTK